MKKKILAGVMSCVLLVGAMGVAACGGGSDIGELELPDYGYFHRYEERVELSIGQIVDKPNSYFGNEKVGMNAVYDLWNETLNTNLKVKFSGTSQDISTQVKNNMYDDDLPDITPCSEVMFDELYTQEMLRDLTPYYEKYASPHLKQVLEYNTMNPDFDSLTDEQKKALKAGDTLASCKKGDSLYAIPMIIDKYSYLPFVYIRTDWLQALAKKDKIADYKTLMPKSSTELVNLAYRFKREIPELLNWQKQLYPIYCNDINFLYQMYGATDSYYEQNADKSWTYSTHKPEMLTALNGVRQLVADGIFDSRFFTEQGNAASVVKNGGCGIYIGRFWQPLQEINDTVKLIDGADWEVDVLYDAQGQIVEPYSRPNLTLYYVVSYKCRNPEALFFMLNHIVEGAFDPEAAYSKQLGELMLDKKYASCSGDMWEWSPVVFDVPDKNYYSSKEVLEAMETGDKDGLMPSSYFVYDRIDGWAKNPNAKTNTYDWIYNKIYKEVVPITVKYEGRINYGGYHGTATEQMVAKATVVSNYQQTQMMTFMTQETPVTQEQFDNFVRAHRELGIKAILDELDTYYSDTWFQA